MKETSGGATEIENQVLWLSNLKSSCTFSFQFETILTELSSSTTPAKLLFLIHNHHHHPHHRRLPRDVTFVLINILQKHVIYCAN